MVNRAFILFLFFYLALVSAMELKKTFPSKQSLRERRKLTTTTVHFSVTLELTEERLKAGGEKFLKNISQKLRNKITNNDVLFPGIRVDLAKVKTQTITPTKTENNRKLTERVTMDLTVYDPELLTSVNNLNDAQLKRKSDRFVKNYYYGLGRKLDLMKKTNYIKVEGTLSGIGLDRPKFSGEFRVPTEE